MTDPTKPRIGAREREAMIAEAAYYRALERGFGQGDPVDDWLEAEREVDARFELTHEARLTHLREQLAEANDRIAGLVAGLGRRANEEWAEELERIHHLRDRLADRLGNLRGLGAEAAQHARQQADKLRAELNEAVRKARNRLH